MFIAERHTIAPYKYEGLGMRSLDTIVCESWLTFSVFLRMIWHRWVYVHLSGYASVSAITQKPFTHPCYNIQELLLYDKPIIPWYYVVSSYAGHSVQVVKFAK